MTTPDSTPPSLDQVRKILRDAGLRCTSARLWVMQLLTEAHSPLTHAEVVETLGPKGFDPATIFRNLKELSETGLVSRIELGDHVWRFELKRGNSDGSFEHPHFVCVDCGGVTCLDDVNVAIRPTAGKSKKKMEVTEVLLKGHCGSCDTK